MAYHHYKGNLSDLHLILWSRLQPHLSSHQDIDHCLDLFLNIKHHQMYLNWIHNYLIFDHLHISGCYSNYYGSSQHDAIDFYAYW